MTDAVVMDERRDRGDVDGAAGVVLAESRRCTDDEDLWQQHTRLQFAADDFCLTLNRAERRDNLESDAV
jgi:hypothetical protein